MRDIEHSARLKVIFRDALQAVRQDGVWENCSVETRVRMRPQSDLFSDSFIAAGFTHWRPATAHAGLIK